MGISPEWTASTSLSGRANEVGMERRGPRARSKYRFRKVMVFSSGGINFSLFAGKLACTLVPPCLFLYNVV